MRCRIENYRWFLRRKRAMDPVAQWRRKNTPKHRALYRITCFSTPQDTPNHSSPPFVQILQTPVYLPLNINLLATFPTILLANPPALDPQALPAKLLAFPNLSALENAMPLVTPKTTAIATKLNQINSNLKIAAMARRIHKTGAA